MGRRGCRNRLRLGAEPQPTERLECLEIEKAHFQPVWRLDRQREPLIIHGARYNAGAIWPRRIHIRRLVRPSLSTENAIADDPDHGGNCNECG